MAGAQGVAGAQGPKGDPGADGPQGVEGPQGPAGAGTDVRVAKGTRPNPRRDREFAGVNRTVVDRITMPAGGSQGELRSVKVDAEFALIGGQGNDIGTCVGRADLTQVGGDPDDGATQQYPVSQEQYTQSTGSLTAVFPAVGGQDVTIELAITKSSSPNGCTSTAPLDDLQVFQPAMSAVSAVR